MGVFFFVLGWGVTTLVRRLTPSEAATAAKAQQHAARNEASLRQSVLSHGGTEADVQRDLQWVAEHPHKPAQPESSADAEARLAQLKQQEEAPQKKIDDRRQHGQ